MARSGPSVNSRYACVIIQCDGLVSTTAASRCRCGVIFVAVRTAGSEIRGVVVKVHSVCEMKKGSCRLFAFSLGFEEEDLFAHCRANHMLVGVSQGGAI